MGNGALGRRRDDAWVPMDETGDYVEEDAVHISPKSVEDCLVHGGSMHNVGVMSHILGRIESHANRDAEHSGLYEAVTEHRDKDEKEKAEAERQAEQQRMLQPLDDDDKARLEKLRSCFLPPLWSAISCGFRSDTIICRTLCRL
eukprot:g1498.t1